MLTFTKDITLTYLIFLGWIITGIYFPPLSYVLITTTYLLFMIKRRDVDLIIGLVLLLVLSDSFYLPFAKTSKIVVFLLFSAYTLRNRLPSDGNTIFKSLIPFFLLAGFLLVGSPDIKMAFQKYLSYLLLFLCVPIFLNYYVDKYGYDELSQVLKICFVLLFAGFVITIIDPDLTFSHGNRYKGIFGNPNGLGIFAFLTFVLFDVCKKHLKVVPNVKENIMYTSLILVSLMLTQSRGSILGCLLFIGVQRLGRFGSIFLIIGVIFYALAFEEVLLLIFSVVDSLELGEVLRLESIEQLEKGSGRTIAWQFAWEEIQKNFFFGRGWSYDEIYMGGVVKQILLKLNHQGGVHNSFLIFWLNVGIVGLLLFIGSLFYLILKTSRISPLAIPFFAGALFIANFEPWLSASLNPYTILYLMIVTLLLKEKPTGDEELA